MIKNMCKGLIPFVLSLCLLLAGCGLFPGSDGIPVDPGSSKQSLWGKNVTMVKTSVPQEAFDAGGAKSCYGMAPDGVTFLMSDGAVPYLYNTKTHTMMTLTPADSRVSELIRGILGSYDAENGKSTDYSASNGEELTRALCSMGIEDGPRGPRVILPVCQSGNYLLGYVYGNFQLLIDCSTGKYHMTDRGMISGVYEGKMLLQQGVPETEVLTVDLETGETSSFDFAGVGGFENGTAMKAAAWLQDGNFCAVLRDQVLNMKTGVACAVAIGSPGKDMEVYSLGKHVPMQEPDTIVGIGTDYVIVYSRPTARKNHPYLINRKTGTVSVLSIGENEIIAQPLDGLLQGDGFPDLSGSGASMLVVDGMSDGETVLIHTLNAISSLVMYHVPTGEIQTLTADGYTGIAAPQMFSGNHYDSFWMFNWNDFTEYTQLVIK